MCFISMSSAAFFGQARTLVTYFRPSSPPILVTSTLAMAEASSSGQSLIAFRFMFSSNT